MNNVLGLIMNSSEANLRDLTEIRPALTLPFGGRYRLMDFALSNLVNAEIKKVGIFGSDKYRSLIDHVGTGQEWSLARKNQELLILQGGLPDYFNKRYVHVNLQDFIENSGIFTRSRQDYVVLCASNTICNIDLKKALDHHIERKADVTILTRKVLDSTRSSVMDIFVEADENERIKGLHLDSEVGNEVSMGFIIVNNDLLQTCMKAAPTTHEYDLIRQLKALCPQIAMYTETFGGYFRRINTLDDYFKANMDLLNPAIVDRLLGGDNWISTKNKDNPPTRYLKSGRAIHSLIASGCKIAGSIDSSVLFRECTIGTGSTVQNSILLESCNVGEGVVLNYVIADRGVSISDGVVLQGTPENPVVLHKGTQI